MSGARVLLRHGMTLLLAGLGCALVAPTIATVLLAARTNGLGADLLYSPMLAPLAVLYAGGPAFLLGALWAWMVLALVRLDLNLLPARVGAAVVIASTAWALSAPLPAEVADASGLGDWTIWTASAVLTSLVFTRGWWARRAAMPASLSGE
jgi:hypothetical protein